MTQGKCGSEELVEDGRSEPQGRGHADPRSHGDNPGTRMQLYSRPATVFVAEFVGTMNRIPGDYGGARKA